MYVSAAKCVGQKRSTLPDFPIRQEIKQDECCITHEHIEENIDSIYQKTRERLLQQDQLVFSKEETLKLLDELMQFEFGRFLLQNRGCNGYWTSYLILHSLQKESYNDLEKWMIYNWPVALATRERFNFFQSEIQKRLCSGMQLASIPCGLMDDLLTLNLEDFHNISFDGIDLDEASLALAQENAQKHGVESSCLFLKKNAWNLEIDSKYDLIVSNGLNMYESNDEKIIELYRNFYQALRPNGVLITSFFVPMSGSSDNINSEDMRKQKAIFVDILQTRWQTFRTEELTRSQLESVGFNVLEVKYDSQGIFPTIIAEKIK